MHSADGSNGFQYLVYLGALPAAVKRVPSTRRNSKTVVHRQQDVCSLSDGKDMCQAWEDEESGA